MEGIPIKYVPQYSITFIPLKMTQLWLDVLHPCPAFQEWLYFPVWEGKFIPQMCRLQWNERSTCMKNKGWFLKDSVWNMVIYCILPSKCACLNKHSTVFLVSLVISQQLHNRSYIFSGPDGKVFQIWDLAPKLLAQLANGLFIQLTSFLGCLMWKNKQQ